MSERRVLRAPDPSLTIQSIGSLSQRALLTYWASVAKRRPYPSLDEFRPEPRLHDPKQLLFWNIEESAKQGRTFRLLGQGRHVTEAFHGNGDGLTMEQVMPPNVRDFIIQTANECADTGCPLYSILATSDTDGKRVDCERLLLPFGSFGRVTQLLASLQLISVDGHFDRGTVLQRFELKTEVVLSGLVNLRAPHTRERLLD